MAPGVQKLGQILLDLAVSCKEADIDRSSVEARAEAVAEETASVAEALDSEVTLWNMREHLRAMQSHMHHLAIDDSPCN